MSFSDIPTFNAQLIGTLNCFSHQRDKINRRIYYEKDIAWLNFIFRLKETNMPIKQIQYYSKLRYKGNSTLKERLKLLEKQMDRLHIQKSNVEDNILHLEEKINTYKEMINKSLLRINK
ncbi:MerR family transcriptional regulator [Clostridium tyrobutyricum]|nr:MerR family transcriptional regulator [Clostridium tyrobutyricum]MBV4431126.1 MerR family transcriptional regulator [Clostridium tyrobutyricum]MBV4434652.1 MerR family transcriptional regulator [Clostridium tyrobutyricum]MBV4436236.1 MerR family transcriptional regulator [Clostridium tyrobutyricum]MBV4445976.1 MerR family transcriptional regulator [Clostridium tyrobutyricum]